MLAFTGGYNSMTQLVHVKRPIQKAQLRHRQDVQSHVTPLVHDLSRNDDTERETVARFIMTGEKSTCHMYR